MIIDRMNRRQFIGIIGSFIGTGVLGSTASARAEREMSEKFRVEGRERVKIKYNPDVIEVEKTKQSPDLAKRYDITPPQLITKEEFNRDPLSDEENEKLPDQGVDQFERDWETYLAQEEEWKEYLEEEKAQDEVQIQHDHDEDLEDLAHHGAWAYEQSCSAVSGGFCIGETYETTSPINIVFDLASTNNDIDDVTDVLSDNDWSTTIAEYTRYAWNTEEEEFEEQHDSAASGPFGVMDERDHVRHWQFGSRVSMQAHRDSEIDHEYVSYEESEERVAEIFDDAGWTVQEDWFEIENDAGDHNGTATGIFP